MLAAVLLINWLFPEILGQEGQQAARAFQVDPVNDLPAMTLR